MSRRARSCWVPLSVLMSELEEGARRSDALSASAAAIHAQALVESDAEAGLRALEMYRATSHVVQTARCARDVAPMLVGQGRKDEAIALLRAAAEVSSSIGAIGDLATIDIMLRSRVAPRLRLGVVNYNGTKGGSTRRRGFLK